MSTDILKQIRFSDLRHLDTLANDNDIRVSGFVFCAAFMVAFTAFLLGGFFLGLHAMRGFLGPMGVGL